MYCPRCRAQWSTGDEYCDSCGRNLKCLTKAKEPETKPVVQSPAVVTEPTTPPIKVPQMPDYPMKWHYFLIYCFLINCAIGHFMNSVIYFFVIFTSGSLAIWCLLYVAAEITLGIISLTTRSSLSNRRRAGPSQLTKYFITNLCVEIFWMIVMMSSDAMKLLDKLTDGMLTGSSVFSIIFTGVEMILLACACHSYYSNRSALFTRS